MNRPMDYVDDTPEAILHFWFGDSITEGIEATARFNSWFQPTPKHDALLRDRFVATVERAVAGEFDHWVESPLGSLALIILLEQLTRTIYRGTRGAFATDARASAIALQGIERQFDLGLTLIERVIFYIPFEHAENLEMQDRCVGYFQQLDDLATPEFKEITAACVVSSREHREVICKFGHFPHRNGVLGRSSTDEELEWVEHHHGWGQSKRDAKGAESL